MSGSILSSQTASASANQAASKATNAAAAASLTSTSTGSSANALDSLTSNLNSFLNLLMTQLKNQDPTSPLDTTQFTAELVQFAGVQQQINTNTNLNQLIQLTQGEETLQGSNLIGKQVDLNSTTLPLQNGTGTIDYTAISADEPIQLTINNSSGHEVFTTNLTAPNSGANLYAWNGKDDNGNQLPDGSYTIAMQGTIGSTLQTVPFTVLGKVTGVINNSGTIELNVGPLTTSLNAIQSVQ
jgi:flagellar basal-body rod modification protein FlgD